MTDLATRPLTAADGAAWHALMTEGGAAHPDAFLLSPAEMAAMSDERMAERAGDGTLTGLFDGDRLAGFAGVTVGRLDRIRHAATLGPFLVAAAWRGTGAADLLMEAALAAARAEGARTMTLWVADRNARAVAFYRRHGFEAAGRIPMSVIMEDGTPRDDLILWRAI
ncbi:GNAT family N-acetyltransferase [Jannaschia sp. Os4]|uniref:GNAT family N-acetyltransferase n=1 Tax=Jannaschia sp. Os4 TaxID=2807617 RepID=UPI00193A9DFF|nr:GNAT family N-acetyltransferase [Jannaschia sp. Os4]MBM2576767.1 GNAT family N-acetyltransferase [Jannaschia sp. Os4]